MGRHVSLPGADELFRRTDLRPLTDLQPLNGGPAVTGAPPPLHAVPDPAASAATERLAVRLPAALVLDLERVRGHLARDHALPVTRSELIAAALTIALGEFDAQGAASGLVEQLRAE